MHGFWVLNDKVLVQLFQKLVGRWGETPRSKNLFFLHLSEKWFIVSITFLVYQIGLEGADFLEVIIQTPKRGEKEYLLVCCHNISPELSDLLSHVQDPVLIAHAGNKTHRIKATDIYYLESVNNTVFLYSKDVMYESKQKLYEFEKMLHSGTFLRISKSAVVNLSKIVAVASGMHSRLEATLSNGEVVIVTRTYIDVLKKRIGL